MDYRFWRFYDRRGKNKKLSKAREGQEKENCEGGGEGGIYQRLGDGVSQIFSQRSRNRVIT